MPDLAKDVGVGLLVLGAAVALADVVGRVALWVHPDPGTPAVVTGLGLLGIAAGIGFIAWVIGHFIHTDGWRRAR